MIPSCESTWSKSGTVKPRIYILEVRDKVEVRDKEHDKDPPIARLLVGKRSKKDALPP